MVTGQEQYISTVGNNRVHSTVGNNRVHVAAQQHQPLLRLFLSTNGGVTTRTTAVVRRQEGKKPDDKWLGISIEETYGAIRSRGVQHHHPSGAAVSGPSHYRRLGTPWRQHKTVFTIWGGILFPRAFLNACCNVWTDPHRRKSRPAEKKPVIGPSTFSVKYGSYK